MRDAGWARAATVLTTVFGLTLGPSMVPELSSGAVAAPSPAATQNAPAPSERARVLALYSSAGPVVGRAAEAALVGTDADVRRFLTEEQPTAAEHDDRIRLVRMLADAGPAVRDAANTALSGSVSEVRAFLDTGWRQPWENDQRRRVNQLMARGGPQVVRAGDAALKGTAEDVRTFLATGWTAAAAQDDRVRVTKILAAAREGSAVYVACQRALDGTVEDIEEFLRSGWQVAVQRDEESLTVKGLAELAAASQAKAAEQTEAATEAANQSIAAAQKAKEAAERAAAETAAAQGDARRAAQAASRAADAAQGAAAAAQTAINAAGRASDAARVASNAAGQAAIAASLTERAAARAHDAAAGAAREKGKAHDARVAAEQARDVAKSATEAAKAADAAGRATGEAGKAGDAARGAGKFADDAAKAAEDAAASAKRAGASAAEAERAARRARQAAAEAQRASAKTQSLAQQAAQAAFEARDAANSAAEHANRAADAADEAAAHAGEAEHAAQRAATAAAEADKAAVAAKSAADKAHQVADTARAADAERLAQQQSQALREAQEAVEDEASRVRTEPVWQAGQATVLDEETQRLLTEAAHPDTAAPLALSATRRAALRLYSRAGPWVRGAAEETLGGTDAGVLDFLRTGVARAVELDDRASANIIALTTDKQAEREAAVTALRAGLEQVREFLRTRSYEGKTNDDRKLVNQIMAAAGADSAVYAAGNEALTADSRGDAQALRRFLEQGQHTAAVNDDRKAANRAIATGGPEVQAAAQAALTGPHSHLKRFLKVGLPKAQLRDADTATHVAQIAGYLAKADQSAALARENANQAASQAALARQAADEAQEWSRKAEESAAQAAAAARAAQQSAAAAQRSADQAAESARRAREAAKAAEGSAREASAAAARASASATRARAAAAAAQADAQRARADAIQAGKDAEAAERAASEARHAAAELALLQETRENAGEVPDEKTISPFGVEKAPENLKDNVTVDKSSADCWGGRAEGFVTCTFKVNHHITGTLRLFTYNCPAGATAKEQCQRVEIGTSPIDFTYTTVGHFSTAEMTAEFLAQIAKATIEDFRKCATEKGGAQAQACGWTALALMPHPKFLRLGELLATAGRTSRSADEFSMFLKDGQTGITASLDNGGYMTMAIMNKTGIAGVGGKMLTAAAEHFGPRLKGIDGVWIAGKDMGDNINTFNRLLREGKNITDAARGTFTGIMAGRLGFKKVEILGRKGEHGNYEEVHLRFT
ncbi:ALF repeat-containing protein [Crossiella sp. SN42]|uniref:ALF repeat-containing protein n=1 Tax=Crossiella sp. SN42 TaxID=2944808 RepID=UPI00207C9FB0|nr:ALF repeat-containing protein [Crossiella sp. SN42]MCO1577904.1 ALF repeat-containing protein [Crossiella sp. SN42]